ncbi:MAG TPA: hypothetical protein VNR11_22120 [Xanthobacteraceae bacterium]|nr:hypothetical protein [Xanthobacteraceae bacterium]
MARRDWSDVYSDLDPGEIVRTEIARHLCAGEQPASRPLPSHLRHLLHVYRERVASGRR